MAGQDQGGGGGWNSLPEWKRGQLLPIERNEETGGLRPAVPQVVFDMLNALALPHDVMEGDYSGIYEDPETGRISSYSPDLIRDAALASMEYAMPGLAGGGARVAREGVDPNLLSIFGGRNAQKPPLQAFDQFATREADIGLLQDLGMPGATNMSKAQDLWTETGVFRGFDGQLRFEIPDSELRLTEVPHNSEWSSGYADEMLEHLALFEQYPALKNIWVNYMEHPREGGSFQKGSVDQQPSIVAHGPDEETIRSVLAHELQHAVQRREGFSSGANVDGTLRSLSQLAELPEEEAANIGHNMYQRVAGEVEARNVASRMGAPDNYNQQVSPTISMDTPFEQQFSIEQLANAVYQNKLEELTRGTQSAGFPPMGTPKGLEDLERIRALLSGLGEVTFQ